MTKLLRKSKSFDFQVCLECTTTTWVSLKLQKQEIFRRRTFCTFMEGRTLVSENRGSRKKTLCSGWSIGLYLLFCAGRKLLWIQRNVVQFLFLGKNVNNGNSWIIHPSSLPYLFLQSLVIKENITFEYRVWGGLMSRILDCGASQNTLIKKEELYGSHIYQYRYWS